MQWPWRRRRHAKGRVVFIGTSPFDVARVAAAAPPPVAATPEVVAALAAVPTPSPVVEAFVPDEPRAGVQLGFADGSVMTIPGDDPRAVALLAAAARLTGDE